MSSSLSNLEPSRRSAPGFPSMRRSSLLHIAFQVLIDNLFRLKLQLGVLIWVCFVIPITGLVSQYYGTRPHPESYVNAIQSLNPFISVVTFFLAMIITFWGLWTRQSYSHFPSRYFLLPVSTPTIVAMALLSQVFLCVAAVMIGLAIPIWLGFDFDLSVSLPLYFVGLVFAIYTNWCRTEIRFLGYLALVTGFICFLAYRTEFFVDSNGIYDRLDILQLSIVIGCSMIGLIFIGGWVIRSQRRGVFIGFQYLSEILFSEQDQATSDQLRESIDSPGFLWFDNWTSKLAMLTAYDLKRVWIPIAILVTIANLFAFALIAVFGFDSGEIAVICLFFSFGGILIGCFMHSIRSRLADNEIRSHLSVLPIDDKKLGLNWLLNLWLIYFLSLAIFLFSLAPILAYMLLQRETPYKTSFLPPIHFIMLPILIISLINGLMTVGRITFIVRTFMIIAGGIVLSVFAAMQQWNTLLYMMAFLFSAFMFVIYVAILWASIKTETFVWWTHLGMIILCALQLDWGYDFMFGSPIYKNFLFGLILFPALPFVFAPLGTYLNRHR